MDSRTVGSIPNENTSRLITFRTHEHSLVLLPIANYKKQQQQTITQTAGGHHRDDKNNSEVTSYIEPFIGSIMTEAI